MTPSALPMLGPRLLWLTGLRLGVLMLILIATGVFHLRERLILGFFSGQLVMGVLAAAFSAAAVQAALLRRGSNLRAIAYSQILADQLTWSLLAYVSGGVASGITSFYGLTCLMGAVLDGVSGVIFAAIVALVLLSLMCAGFVFGVLPPPPDQVGELYLRSWRDLSFPFAQAILALITAALLAGYLAERLRRTGGQLQEAQARAAQAEQLAMLGRFAAGLAHEIRNPLGAISASAELLAMAPALSGEDRLLCDIIQREAGRLNELVTDMLGLARPRAPEKAPVNLCEVAPEVVRLSSMTGKGTEVQVSFDGPGRPVLIDADPSQLRQVLWNLVRNAIQASAAGAEVRVRVREIDGMATLEVEDRGQGIGEAAKERLFDAFFTTRSHGVGIGLAVVKRIVDDHGWQIDVESQEGQGALFRVTAPLQQA